jgi:hypothetical protein
MKLFIRVIQIVLVFEGLSQAYAATLATGLSAYGGQGFSRSIVGAAATILTCGLIVFLLQKYIEHKYSAQTVTVSAKKFLGLSLLSLVVVASVSLGIVALLLILAFIKA